MQQTNNHMFSTIHHVIRNTRVGLLAGLSLVIAPLAVTAATNTFHFSNTTVNAGSGPVNPANGVTAIVGTNLIAGDVVVFDGIVINVPGSTADAWGAVEMGAGGYLGLTSDVLGVLAETGKTSGNRWQLFVNGASTQFGSAALDAKTNRVHIELDCTLTGSTTNLTYLVEIDQGGTGTYNDSLSGSSEPRGKLRGSPFRALSNVSKASSLSWSFQRSSSENFLLPLVCPLKSFGQSV